MTKEEFLKLDEKTQRSFIIVLVELWVKNTEHKEKRSAFICLANDEDKEEIKFSNYTRGTGILVLVSIIQHLSNHPKLKMLLTKYLTTNSLKKE